MGIGIRHHLISQPNFKAQPRRTILSGFRFKILVNRENRSPGREPDTDVIVILSVKEASSLSSEKTLLSVTFFPPLHFANLHKGKAITTYHTLTHLPRQSIPLPSVRRAHIPLLYISTEPFSPRRVFLLNKQQISCNGFCAVAATCLSRFVACILPLSWAF